MKINSVGHRVAFALALGVPIVLTLAMQLANVEETIVPAEMETDRLYPFVLLQDLFIEGGRLSAWNLQWHSDFFPDLIVATLAFVVAHRAEVWLQVYAALNVALYFAIAWYFFFIHRRAVRGQAKAVGIPLFLAFAITVFTLFAWNWGLFELFLRDISYPSHHYGASLCAVLGCLIAIDAFDAGSRPSLWGGIIIPASILFLVTVSDTISVPVVVAPFIVATGFYAVVTRKTSAAFLATCLSVLGAIALAYLFGRALTNLFAELTPKPIGLHPDVFLRETALYLRTLFAPERPAQTVIASLLVAAVLMLIVKNAVTAGKAVFGRVPQKDVRSAKADAFAVFLVSVFVANPLAFAAIDALWSPELVRRTVAIFFCGLWAAASQANYIAVSEWRESRLVGSVVGAAILFSVIPWNLGTAPWKLQAKIPLLRCLRHFQPAYNLTRGLGFHWDTTPVTIFSKREITILLVKNDARIWHWMNNLDWYSPAVNIEPFTFLVLSPQIDAEAIARMFGNPAHILNCKDAPGGAGNAVIWVFDWAQARLLTDWITQQYTENRILH
jgi:hypothetical protein